MNIRSLLMTVVFALPLFSPTPILAENPQPRIVSDEPVMNYGEVDNNQVIEHTFVVRNDGDALLEISRVRPACGCTVANISSQRLAPGESAEITTRLNLQGRTGRQRKTMAVDSNDPNTPTLTLTMDGVALTEINVTPQRLLVNNIKQGEEPEVHRIDILSNASQPISIQSLSTGNPLVTAELETVEEGRRYAILVRTTGELPQGPTHGRIQVQTDHPRRPSIQIPFQFMVVGDITVAPQELAMVEQAEGTISRNVVLRPGIVKDFTIVSVTPPADTEIETSIRNIGVGYMIQVNNIHPTMDLNGKSILIATDVPGMEELIVPFRVVARPAGR